MKDYREMADNVLRRRDAYRIKRQKNIRITVSVLSGFCVITLLGAGIRYSGILAGDGSEQVKDVQPKGIASADTFDGTDSSITMRSEEKQQQTAQSSIKDSSADINREDLSEPKDSGVNNNISPESTGSETTIDAPVSDIPGDTGALTAYDEVWGGCYMDQNGCWVVLLTEDTPENRQMVLTLNPTLREDNTIFKTAAYSKAYLTYLMAEISNAMCAGKLPLVTTAALREDRNCVEVTMISDAPYSVDKVLAFDTVGGAIEIIYDSERHVIMDLEEYGIMDLRKDPER